MNAIVAVDMKYQIGNKGKLLFRIPADMKFFKETTMHKVVVMGSKTFESIGKPLDNRINLVITHNPEKYSELLNEYNSVYFGTLDQVREKLEGLESDRVFIIGGQSIYEEFIDECKYLYITHYNRIYDEADASFPMPLAHQFDIDGAVVQPELYDNQFYYTFRWINRKFKNQ